VETLLASGVDWANSRITISIRTKKDDPFQQAFRSNAIPQILDSLLVNHSRALFAIILSGGVHIAGELHPGQQLAKASSKPID
jgi:hypothetical protein